MRRILALALLHVVAFGGALPVSRSLDGSGNNPAHPRWGAAGRPYVRDARTNYSDGIGAMTQGPNARYISNRIFNDFGQNLFSENGVSQWAWVWGQFVDHDLGLRDETPGESAPVAFDAHDPLESFTNDFGALGFARTPAAPGTGTSPRNPRQQINTLNSFIDASNVYGVDASRLEWLRGGPVNGDLSDNDPRLMLPGGYLPLAGARGAAATPPAMDLFGAQMGAPATAVVAGDVRANENIALTAVQTLFAREHNRIVDSLPDTLTDQQKFDVARRVVGAEVQYITYTEFLPALGVTLPAYRGYNPRVNPTLSDEFATVGFRAHSMVHGQFDVPVDLANYSQDQMDAFRAEGIDTGTEDGRTVLIVPLTVAFGNPALVEQIGLAPILAGLGLERQYRNDEQIDNSMRSVLFQVPKPGASDPGACGQPVVNPNCYSGVEDLGALDVMRGRDHGMPSYNSMRRAYGLRPKRSFTAITGESTSRFPSDPAIDPHDPIDDPNILDFVQLRDAGGNVIEPGTPAAQENAVTGIRRTTLAARLRAIYGSVSAVDAFVGMVSERHVPGTEFGPLQLAMWRSQFRRLRDGDRFFYLNDPQLGLIAQRFHIRYDHSLADIIRFDSGAGVATNVFNVADVSGGGDTTPSTPARRRVS